MTATTARSTARKSARFARVLGRLDNGELMVEVEDRRPTTSKFSHYYISPIPADYGKAFRFEKFAAEGGEVYAVNLGDEREPASCECLGHLRFGHKTVCRHIASARALVGAGKLA